MCMDPGCNVWTSGALSLFYSTINAENAAITAGTADFHPLIMSFLHSHTNGATQVSCFVVSFPCIPDFHQMRKGDFIWPLCGLCPSIMTHCTSVKLENLHSGFLCLSCFHPSPVLRSGDRATAWLFGRTGWRLLSTQEGKVALGAFVGIVALLTTLETQQRQKKKQRGVSVSLIKEQGSGNITGNMSAVNFK